MKAIEFTTEIRNGVIKMPSEHKQMTEDSARVIILTDEKKTSKAGQDKETIRSILKELRTKNAFHKIEDPVAWQK